MKITEKNKYLLLKTVQETQILPITSACDLDCFFCSHQQNPPDINVYNLGHLSLDLIKELITFLAPQGPIILGESATKIIEGEPLLHPQFKQIITILRDKFPNREIRITTSGSRLDQSMLEFLASQKPLELNLSLNCPTPAARSKIMKDPRPQTVFEALQSLNEYKIDFHGSIVIHPELLAQQGLEKTIDILQQAEAKTIRVFLAGITKYSLEIIKEESDFNQLKARVDKLKQKYRVPILLEPPHLNDFKKVIQGVVIGSPADKAELQLGDVITQVNDQQFMTRVDVFNKIKTLKNPKLKIKRQGVILEKRIEKEADETSGLVMYYDFSSQKIKKLKQLLRNSSKKRIAVITSELAQDLIKTLLNVIRPEFPNKNIELIAVHNNYFGGNIKSVGLLTTDDILESVQSQKYELIIIPQKIYGWEERDLKGDSYQKIEEETGINVKLC